MSLEEMMKPKPLSYYRDLVERENCNDTVAVELSVDESVVLLKAHDHGILALNDEERVILNRVVSALAMEVRP